MSLANLLRKGGLRALATATSATFSTQEAVVADASPVARVATVAVANTPESIVDPEPVNDPEFSDPDRWCWPAGEAMNGAEIELMLARTKLFARRGVAFSAAEELADDAMRRDRDLDDRRLCLECANLQGGKQCSAWQLAAAGRVVEAIVRMPQRCQGFRSVVGS